MALSLQGLFDVGIQVLRVVLFGSSFQSLLVVGTNGQPELGVHLDAVHLVIGTINGVLLLILFLLQGLGSVNEDSNDGRVANRI